MLIYFLRYRAGLQYGTLTKTHTAHHKLESHEISLSDQLLFSFSIVPKFCSTTDSVVCRAKLRNDWATEIDIIDKQDLRLRCVLGILSLLYIYIYIDTYPSFNNYKVIVVAIYYHMAQTCIKHVCLSPIQIWFYACAQPMKNVVT